MSDFWLQKMRTYFVRVDYDHDNVITKKDFEQMADRFVKEGSLNDERAKALRESLFAVWEKFWHHLGGQDRDAINQDEFLAAMKQMVNNEEARAVLKNSLVDFFHAVDTNNDGQISVEEYEIFYICMGVPKDLATGSFRAIDTNNDNQLSSDEFVTAGMDFYISDSDDVSKFFWGPLV